MISNFMIKKEDIEINDVLRKHNINLDDTVLTKNDVVVIPNQWGEKSALLTADDIYVIKELRGTGRKIHVQDQEKMKIQDFRGGEFELAMMIVNEAIKPVLISIVSAWIYDKIKSYREAKKEAPESKVQPPKFKLKYYFTKNKKFVEIEGDAEEAAKILRS